MNWRGGARHLLPYVISAAGGFLIAYLVVAFAIFPSEILPNDALVPNVTGLSYEDAAKRLQLSGFRAGQGEQRFTTSAPRMTVLQQNPPAGSRELRGTKVVLDVSSGQRVGTVPNVVGMARADAERALEQAGFDVGEVATRAGAAPFGEVVEMRPAGGARATQPGPVSLVVSGGPATLQVPEVVGRNFRDARTMLQQLGLRVGVVTIDSTAIEPANMVVAQSPEAGQPVSAGSAVSLRISGRTR
jgi:eukaryotic-like serine/threonine-protein kinase